MHEVSYAGVIAHGERVFAPSPAETFLRHANAIMVSTCSRLLFCVESLSAMDMRSRLLISYPPVNSNLPRIGVAFISV